MIAQSRWTKAIDDRVIQLYPRACAASNGEVANLRFDIYHELLKTGIWLFPKPAEIYIL